jgi:hypothetical protein
VQLVAVDVDRLTLHDLTDPGRGHPDDLGSTRCGMPRLTASAIARAWQIPQFAEVTVQGGDPVGYLQDVSSEVPVIGADAQVTATRACHGGYASISGLMLVVVLLLDIMSLIGDVSAIAFALP